MQIDSIRIIDFRGIKDSEFYFDPHFNVLIGENGSGKTSVLEALAAALNPYVSVSQGKNVRPIRKEDIRIEDFGLHNENKINTHLIVNGQIENKPIKWIVRKPNKDRSDVVENKGIIQKDGRRIITIKQPPLKKDEDIRKIARTHLSVLSEDGGRNLTLPVFDYLGSGRLWQDTHRYIDTLPKGSRYAGLEDCLKSISSLRRFTEWFKTMELSKLQGNETAKWRIEVVQKSIINCLESWDNVFFGVEDDILLAEKDMHSTQRQRLPVSYLSDGQRNIIGIVADIAYRCVLLNPYLELNAAKESPGIVLIDELDLHLHPKWQRTIVQKLKDTFPKIQFITTTHSPFIVQSLKNEELIDLETKKSDTDYYKKGIEDIAEHEMGVDNPIRSEKYNDMLHAAERYYDIIEKNENGSLPTELLHELNEIEIRFTSEPAYVALLKSEKKARLKK